MSTAVPAAPFPFAPTVGSRAAAAFAEQDEAPCPDRLWSLPGIGGRTRVTTSFGDLPAMAVRKNDPLRVRAGYYLPVVDVREYKLDPEFLSARPDASPVVLRRDCLGLGAPGEDILLSPGQMVLDGDAPDAAVHPAKDLPDWAARRQNATDGTAYYVFRLAEPALIHAQGVWLSV